jgi:hypothetical protein
MNVAKKVVVQKNAVITAAKASVLNVWVKVRVLDEERHAHWR